MTQIQITKAETPDWPNYAELSKNHRSAKVAEWTLTSGPRSAPNSKFNNWPNCADLAVTYTRTNPANTTTHASFHTRQNPSFIDWPIYADN